ncbi:hypothetical protein D7Z26_07435 [Cohnella endophytica]|uniref:Uncharacterized protein n=2 Tax=Cohnella endophytica TaxID=2419778 RepID=A0A494Y127_9BACL|nr:hypothetical protein D7Z26_07435 [Cohnella endophytica]
MKISEMFEQAGIDTDAIPYEEDQTVDKEIIRRLVMRKIGNPSAITSDSFAGSKKISVKIALVAAAVAATMMSAYAVNAATGGKLYGAILLNKENRHIAERPNYASMQEVSKGEVSESPSGKPVLTSSIIQASQLRTLNAGSVTNIAVSEKAGKITIPELFTNNGDLVIFTKADGSGWRLNKGEQLSIGFRLDLQTRKKYSDPTGEWMEIGYIRNGELVKGFAKKEKEFSYKITADEPGDYYFYAENYSAGYIIVSSGTIE